MKRVLHISDTHVCSEKNFKTKKRFENLAQTMVSTFNAGDDYVVVVTGDLVDSAEKLDQDGTPENYGLVKPGLETLREHFHKVLVVPGNHDYRRRTAKNKKYPSQALDPVFKKEFLKNSFVEEFQQDPKGKPPWVCPSVEGVTFIGINSMQEELDKMDKKAANGKIGIDQLNRLETALQEATDRQERIVLLLHHHPLNKAWTSLQLKDAGKFKKRLKGYKVDALLFGHNHLISPDTYDRFVGHRTLKVPFVFDAGSATRHGGRGYCIEIDLDKTRHRAFKIRYEGNTPELKDKGWREVW